MKVQLNTVVLNADDVATLVENLQELEIAAGGMGRSTQYILHLPKDVVLNIKLTGRMYGNPDQYYARFDGFKMELVTAEDREFLNW